MSETFRIEDGVAYVGDKPIPWAKVMEESITFRDWGHRHLGFHIPLENGWIVSVQFGTGNYCVNRDALHPDSSGKTRPFLEACPDAEVGVMDATKDERLCEPPGWGGDPVLGWQGPAEVRVLIEWVATWAMSEVPEQSMTEWLVEGPQVRAVDVGKPTD